MTLYNLKENTRKSKKIEILMRHNGETESIISNAISKLTIKEILSFKYATGTDRNKTRIPAPPEVKKLRALKDLDLLSVVGIAKKRRREIVERNDGNNIEDITKIFQKGTVLNW